MAELHWFFLVHEDEIVFTLLALGAVGALAVVVGLFRIFAWPHDDVVDPALPDVSATLTTGEIPAGVPE